jgi:leader peptidase (prepilin peptidase) / N-methyltransferase
MSSRARRGLRARPTLWAWPAAAVLAAVTFVTLGANLNAACWAAVQVVLVVLAAIDIATRRLPNVLTVPVSLLAIGLRAAFVRDALAQVLVAGIVAFAVCAALAWALRGGFGMGDVKLAGMLGFLLGAAVVPALVLGTVVGGVAALALIATTRVRFRSHIAYGPYLAAGGVVAILGFGPPQLI